MKHNFGAGPAILPQEVLEEASQGILDYQQTGLSILEISHRSNEFKDIVSNTKALARELLDVPDNYSIIFTHGGATQHFIMLPLNFLSAKSSAGYVDSGSWATKAIRQAEQFGHIQCVASSAEKNYTTIPELGTISENLAYLHITSNNTIFGTQFHDFPKTTAPLTADMSSDIFSKKINVADFSLIYAGFQKNIGPAGGALAIIKNEFLEQQTKDRKIPFLLDYKLLVKNDSMYNTSPVFAIYTTMLNLQWLKRNGGIDAIEKTNKEKADMLYKALEDNEHFEVIVPPKHRSLMNVCFKAKNENISEKFLALAGSENIIGLKGHRSVGGFRASIYNAMPIENVRFLVELINHFK